MRCDFFNIVIINMKILNRTRTRTKDCVSVLLPFHLCLQVFFSIWTSVVFTHWGCDAAVVLWTGHRHYTTDTNRSPSLFIFRLSIHEKKKNNSIHTLPPWLSEPVSLTRSSWSHSRVCVCAVLGLRHVCLTFHLLNVHLRVSRKTFISQLSDSAFCRKFSCAFKGDVCVFFKEILEKTSMNLAGWNVYIYICILLETLRKWRGRPDLSDSVDPFLQFFSRHTASDDLQGNSILSYEEAGRYTQHRVFKEWEVKEVWLNSPDCHQFLCFFFTLSVKQSADKRWVKDTDLRELDTHLTVKREHINSWVSASTDKSPVTG